MVEPARASGATDERVRYHEQRSREIADKHRNSLLALNTSGIGAMLLIGSWFVDKQQPLPIYLFWPVLLFALGVASTHGSFFAAKHRELKRQRAYERNEPQPSFKWYGYQASTLYEIISTVLFVLGALLAAIMLSTASWPSG